jgi:NADP-dependent 3-hydroxy acid dehydrogenase YdfG
VRWRHIEENENMQSLKGKVAWITGAGTGIGLAGARALAEAGAAVVMSGRRREVLAADCPREQRRQQRIQPQNASQRDQADTHQHARRCHHIRP